MDRTVLTAMLAIGAGAATSCYNPTIADCAIECGAAGACPDNFACNTDRRCVSDPLAVPTCSPIDAPKAIDAPRAIDAAKLDARIDDARVTDAAACMKPPLGSQGEGESSTYACGSAAETDSSAPCFTACTPVATGSAAFGFIDMGSGWHDATVGSADFSTVRAIATAQGGVWIGLRGTSNGSFAWADNSAYNSEPADNDWADGSAPPSPDETTCVIASGSGWIPMPCDGSSFDVLISFKPPH